MGGGDQGRAPNPQAGEIRALTGMRGVAALVVMAGHYLWYQWHATWASNALRPGYLAVDLFFVLSGFVMALSYSRPFINDATLRLYGSFLFRRAARIYPVYLAITLATFTSARLLHGAGSSFTGLLSSLALVQEWGLGRFKPALGMSTIGPGWSISAELVAYLLFPVAVAVFIRPKPLAALSAGLVPIAVVCFLSTLPVLPEHGGPLDIHGGDEGWGVVRCLSEFSIGVLTWRVWTWRKTEWPTGWIDILLIPFIVLWANNGPHLAMFALFPLLVFRGAVAKRGPISWLGSALPHYLGEISYSLYLVHVPILLLYTPLDHALAHIENTKNHYSSIGALAVLSLSLSVPLYELVERPARRRLRSWMEHEMSSPIGQEGGGGLN